MKRVLARGAVLLFGLCSVQPARAASRELEFRLIYRVPPGCPEADVFLARLNEHVGFGGGNYLDGAIVVTPLSGGGFRLWMQFNGSRLDEVRGDDCAALVAEAVRTAGMARTESPGAEAEGQLQRALETAPDPVGWAEVQPPDVRYADAVPVLHTLYDAAAPAPPHVDDATAPARWASAPSAPASWHPGILAHGQWVSGALPRPEIGWGLTLAASYRRVRARLEATLWRGQPWTYLPEARPIEGSLRQQSLALALCHDLTDAAVAGGRLVTTGCLRGGAVALRANASGEYADGVTPYAIAGARLGLIWQYSGFHLELFGGADAALGERTLDPQNDGNDFTAEAWQPAVALAIGWQFGAPSGDSISGSLAKDTAGAD